MFKKAKMSNVKKKGFTLTEVMMAIFIFALMASAASGVFVKMIKSYRYTKIAQRDLESAQYTMNLMAKTLRTSSIDGSGASKEITVYDYSQDKCIKYEFDSDSNEVYLREVLIAGGGISDCDGAVYSDPGIIAKNVDGKFAYSESSDVSGSEAVGRATISITISPGGGHPVHIQSSVSLRDYSAAGI